MNTGVDLIIFKGVLYHMQAYTCTVIVSNNLLYINQIGERLYLVND
jgi:hypothetical protein